MADCESYTIEFGPLRQLVGNLSRLLAALLPVTRLQVRRIKKGPLAPLLVTIFVRHHSNLPAAGLLYGLVEALRPAAFTVGFHISHSSHRCGFPNAAFFEVFIYDQPLPAGFRPRGHPKSNGHP